MTSCCCEVLALLCCPLISVAGTSSALSMLLSFSLPSKLFLAGSSLILLFSFGSFQAKNVCFAIKCDKSCLLITHKNSRLRNMQTSFTLSLPSMCMSLKIKTHFFSQTCMHFCCTYLKLRIAS